MPTPNPTPDLGSSWVGRKGRRRDEHNDGQRRKGTNIPYLAHLLGVCALVLDYGGDEDQAIAGLLHDVIEGIALR